MLMILGTLLTLAFGLLTGGAQAAEELRPMRAPEHGRLVRTSVILEKPVQRTTRHELRQPSQPAEIRFTAESEYVRWKNTLLRKPLMVAGGALEMPMRDGYRAAQKYVELPERKEGVLAYLVRDML